MSTPDDSLIHLAHTIWSGALTLLVAALGWFMRWNWNRLVTELDEKADKDALESQKEALETVKADLDRRHSEMLQVLREIRDGIAKSDAETSQVRASLQQSLQNLVGQVGEIKGWISGQMASKGGA